MAQRIEDMESFIDVIINKNNASIQLPDNIGPHNQKIISITNASWEYIEPEDFTNIHYPDNPILSYAGNGCTKPIYSFNIGALQPWDTYHSIEMKFINIYCDLARSWDGSGGSNNLMIRVPKTPSYNPMTTQSFNYSSTETDEDYLMVRNNQQFLSLRVSKTLYDYGNILSPIVPSATNGYLTYTSQEVPLFTDPITAGFQPQPNFNRPLRLKLKISYA